MADQHDGFQKIQKVKQSSIYTTRIKRHWLTIIPNINDKQLASYLKSKLGCGGSVLEKGIVLQGNQVSRCLKYLREQNLTEP